MAQIITGSIFILVGLIVLFFTVKNIATDFVTNYKGIDTIADVVSAKEDKDGMLNVKIFYNTDEGKQTDRLIETPDNVISSIKGVLSQYVIIPKSHLSIKSPRKAIKTKQRLAYQNQYGIN